jgi:hypothetical protein
MRSGGDVADWKPSERLHSPFAEAVAGEALSARSLGLAEWQEALSPFSDGEQGSEMLADQQIEAVLGELRDEEFLDAVAMLAEETEQAVSDRFGDEAPSYAGERERFAENYLSGTRFEAEQYLSSLESGIAGRDVASLSAEHLDEMLDSFDPQPGELTPAGEEFIGTLVKKAKQAVRVVANAASQAGKLAGKLAMPLLGPVLKQLRKLVQPLLKRVLSAAIGRLPAPLQPAARTLAGRFMPQAGEAEFESDGFEMAPATQFDVETLVDSFDLRLAEAIAYPESTLAEAEVLETGHDEAIAESRELEALAAARGELIDRLRESEDGQSLAPAIEQFVPVLLGALRTGIKLAGRPKVVNLLAGYLAQLIGRWVDKAQATPLSRAIVDTGLKLISLEAESDTGGLVAEAAPTALAGVVEDTVRRLAENESYIFEDEDLTQVALAEAFGEAVAAHFPQEQVRSDLQLAPSLGGTFVTRGPRSLRSYAKYSRTPEIQITERAADTLPAFGGTSLGAVMRAGGARFPLRARMHIYQARLGTTVASMLRHDRRAGTAMPGVYPLTPQAAGLLLRETGLGTAVPNRFLRSRRKLAAGQRLFVLEPLGVPIPPVPGKRIAPGRIWMTINPAKARITLGFFLSEAEAQQIAEAMRQGRGHAALLSSLFAGVKQAAQPQATAKAGAVAQGEGEEFEDFVAGAGRSLPVGFVRLLRRRIGEWALPAVAAWLRENAQAFQRAAAHPDPGVTLRVRLNGVPGLAASRTGTPPASLIGALRGKPAISVTVSSGKERSR